MNPLFIDLNVVILPTISKVQNILKLSQKLYKKHQAVYELNTTNQLPHLSLYSARYPMKNKQEVLNKIKEISSTQQSFPIILQGYSVFSGYIFYDVLPNESSKFFMKLL